MDDRNFTPEESLPEMAMNVIKGGLLKDEAAKLALMSGLLERGYKNARNTGGRPLMLFKSPEDVDSTMERAGFFPSRVAVPEVGQTGWKTWRSGSGLQHVHRHGDIMSMHIDNYPSIQKKYKDFKRTGSMKDLLGMSMGVPHAALEGGTGYLSFLAAKLHGEPSLTKRQATGEITKGTPALAKWPGYPAWYRNLAMIGMVGGGAGALVGGGAGALSRKGSAGKGALKGAATGAALAAALLGLNALDSKFTRPKRFKTNPSKWRDLIDKFVLNAGRLNQSSAT